MSKLLFEALFAGVAAPEMSVFGTCCFFNRVRVNTFGQGKSPPFCRAESGGVCSCQFKHRSLIVMQTAEHAHELSGVMHIKLHAIKVYIVKCVSCGGRASHQDIAGREVLMPNSQDVKPEHVSCKGRDKSFGIFSAFPKAYLRSGHIAAYIVALMQPEP